MHSFSIQDHFHYRTEQVLSSLAAVSLPSWILPQICNSNLGREPLSNRTFHFSRVYRGDSLPMAMTRHQHLLFSQLCLSPKKTVLALFCGNGATCEQLVEFSDVDVVGIDTDARLISRAKVAAENAGLADRLTYHHVQDLGEALEKFPDRSFDAVFAIEPGYRITSPPTLYNHVSRLLKPSGRFAMYEWCFTDKMTLSNANHVAAAANLLRSLPETTEIVSISTMTDLVSTLKMTRLTNVSATDLALREMDIPWYRPLESHQNSRSKSPVSLSWWYGQLSIEALLIAARLRIFSPIVLVTAEKGAQLL